MSACQLASLSIPSPSVTCWSKWRELQTFLLNFSRGKNTIAIFLILKYYDINRANGANSRLFTSTSQSSSWLLMSPLRWCVSIDDVLLCCSLHTHTYTHTHTHTHIIGAWRGWSATLIRNSDPQLLSATLNRNSDQQLWSVTSLSRRTISLSIYTYIYIIIHTHTHTHTHT